MFSTHQVTNINLWVKFILLSASVLTLDQSKILSFGKELNYFLSFYEETFSIVENAIFNL